MYLIPRSQKTQLDANGNGQVEFEIDNGNARWIVDDLRVRTLTAAGQITATPVPRAEVFRNNIAPQYSEGGTYSGNFDQAGGRTILYPGDVLYVVWTGGVPGSTAVAILAGTFDPPGTPLRDN